MLEILAIIALCRTNSRNAGMRGRSTGWAKGYTALLWFGFEFSFAFFAGIFSVILDVELGMGAYLVALIGAGFGALLSWLIAKRGEPIAMPLGNLSMEETGYVQGSMQLSTPCEVVLIREKSFVGMAAKNEIFLNGQAMGRVGNGEVITFLTYASQNVVTGSDVFGMRFKTSAPFEATDGARVEVVLKGGKFLPYRTRVYPGAMQPAGAPAEAGPGQAPQTRCGQCGAWGFPPQPSCPNCGAPQ